MSPRSLSDYYMGMILTELCEGRVMSAVGWYERLPASLWQDAYRSLPIGHQSEHCGCLDLTQRWESYHGCCSATHWTDTRWPPVAIWMPFGWIAAFWGRKWSLAGHKVSVTGASHEWELYHPHHTLVNYATTQIDMTNSKMNVTFPTFLRVCIMWFSCH